MDSQQLNAVLGTVHALLQAEGMNDAAQVVRAYPARYEQTGYDNWNGGTELSDQALRSPRSSSRAPRS